MARLTSLPKGPEAGYLEVSGPASFPWNLICILEQQPENEIQHTDVFCLA